MEHGNRMNILKSKKHNLTSNVKKNFQNKKYLQPTIPQ